MNYETHNFDKDVIRRSHEIPVLVDFWAEWCGPCKVLGPVLEKLAEKHKDRWAFAKLNTEQFPDIAAHYGIRSIPNVKLFVDGNVIDEFAGALPEHTIEQWLQKALPGKYREHMKQALLYLSENKIKKAQKMLKEIIEAEPQNHQAVVLMATTYVYTEPRQAIDLIHDINEDSEYYDAADAIRTFGNLFQLGENGLPEDNVKDQYLTAIQALRSGDFDSALKNFIDVIRTKRSYENDGARKACIAIFKFLGENSEITQKHRSAFSNALF